jgi:hypothetical protein
MNRITTALLASVMVASVPLAGGTALAAKQAKPTLGTPQHVNYPLVVGKRPIDVVMTVESDAPEVKLQGHPLGSATPLKTFTGTAEGQVWTFHTTLVPADPVGLWELTATATANGETTTVTRTTFTLAAGRFTSFRVQPTIVRKGKQIYFSGGVQHTVNGRWQWLDNANVHIFYSEDKPTPDTKGTEVTHAPSDRRGRFSSRVTADASGWYWATFFEADSNKGVWVGASKTHAVHVKVVKARWGGMKDAK